MGISSQQRQGSSSTDDNEDEFERAARFLQDFHRPSLSLHVIAEEEDGEEQDGPCEVLTPARENANRRSLSKMEASMCLSSLALISQENGKYQEENDTSVMMFHGGHDRQDYTYSREDSSSPSWGQFISSDEDAFVPSSSSHKTSSMPTSSSSSSSSPSSVQSGCYYFGTFNLPRHYRRRATKSS